MHGFHKDFALILLDFTTTMLGFYMSHEWILNETRIDFTSTMNGFHVNHEMILHGVCGEKLWISIMVVYVEHLAKASLSAASLKNFTPLL